MAGIATGAVAQTALTGSSYWYYPDQVNSANRFYVQTSSGLNTIAGCSYGGYLPLFADIKSSGNFFVYEWYPARPRLLCDCGAGLGRATKKAGSRAMSRAAYPLLQLAVFGPTTSTSMYIRELFLRLP